MHQCRHRTRPHCAPRPNWLPTRSTHTPPRRETPLRKPSSVIVITPSQASDSDFTFNDHQRRPHRNRRRSPCRPMPNKWSKPRRGGGSSDSEDELRRGDVQDPRRRKPSPSDRPTPVIVAAQEGTREKIATPTSQQGETKVKALGHAGTGAD